MPAVSVVIPNWNGAHLLPVCLDSVRAQTFRDLETVVVDDGSTDQSAALVQRNYPEVRVLRLPQNVGFCRAANEGVRASRGEFLALINNDTELHPECVGELVAAMRGDAGLGICAAKMVYYDDPGMINSAGQACGPDGVVVDIGRRQADGEWFSRPREVLGACAGGALYRRSMVEQIGLFDADFLMSFEDADLSWRAQWAGWRARYVPSAVVKHREGVSRQIRSKRAAFLGMRNTVHVWRKDWPLGSLVRHLPGICKGWRAAGMALVRRGHAGLLPAAAVGALAQMPRMLSRRRLIRRSRAASAGRFQELLTLGERHTRRPPED
jgi:GT2 family glycosyltransferase